MTDPQHQQFHSRRKHARLVASSRLPFHPYPAVVAWKPAREWIWETRRVPQTDKLLSCALPVMTEGCIVAHAQGHCR